MPRRNNAQKPPKHRPFSAGGNCQGKVRYQTKQQADKAAEDLQIMQPSLHLRTYQCLHCGGWHLTRQALQ